MEAGQLDLSLSVAVCAWCKPRVPMGEMGALSHGICPRHLRKVKQELQGILPRRYPRNRTDQAAAEALLPL
ncbi:MAG TPA: hypothetical protein VFZ59_06490 [Verrucomicrobiae bacterium]|nr:hypothetical protein [Verrucomicrobiae bacterium]